jgi:hypothetical protein
MQYFCPFRPLCEHLAHHQHHHTLAIFHPMTYHQQTKDKTMVSASPSLVVNHQECLFGYFSIFSPLLMPSPQPSNSRGVTDNCPLNL